MNCSMTSDQAGLCVVHRSTPGRRSLNSIDLLLHQQGHTGSEGHIHTNMPGHLLACMRFQKDPVSAIVQSHRKTAWLQLTARGTPGSWTRCTCKPCQSFESQSCLPVGTSLEAGHAQHAVPVVGQLHTNTHMGGRHNQTAHKPPPMIRATCMKTNVHEDGRKGWALAGSAHATCTVHTRHIGRRQQASHKAHSHDKQPNSSQGQHARK